MLQKLNHHANICFMPIIKSAIKKMRKDKTRTERNRQRKTKVEIALKTVKRKPTPKNLSQAFSSLDKAVKVNLIHKNRASRLKSKLSSLLQKTSQS